VLRKAGWKVSTPEFDVEGDRIRSVIAHTETGDPEKVVMAGAHLDSVEDGPGMNDNGSGSAALLELAVRMGGFPRVTNQVRLAWWGAEEVDMDGSTHYVETLSRADQRKIALYLNLDMVASPNVGYLVEGKDGCDEDAADGSAEVARVLAERLVLPPSMRCAGQRQRAGAGPIHRRSRGDRRLLRNIGLRSSRP
jgi:aminopeptidase S